jgi:hypothetical protein
MEYAFDINLRATVRIQASTANEALALMQSRLNAVNPSAVIIGDVRVTEMTLDTDLAGPPTLFEVTEANHARP